MMQSDTPKTRAPQFSHLKGKELYHAVKELPLWIMMQEFSPLFSTKEVTLQWLVDVQGINPHINRTKIDTDPIRTAMTKYGFPLSNYREPGLRGAYSQMWKTSSDNVKTILIFLRDMAPTANLAATNGIGSPTSATGRATRCTVANVILQMDGPVGEELIVAGANFDSAVSINGTDMLGPRQHSSSKVHTVHACIEAQIDVYFNKNQKQWWADHLFFLLRVIAPDLNPWSIDGSIFDTNPGLLNADHPLRDCHSAFWKATIYDRTTRTEHKDARATCDLHLHVYCRHHQRFEHVMWNVAKMFQRVAGFYTHQE